MRALEVGDHPAVQAADNLVRDLDCRAEIRPSSGMHRSPSVRPMMNRWSRMRIISPSVLPSSKTVSTATGGRTVGRNGTAERAAVAAGRRDRGRGVDRDRRAGLPSLVSGQKRLTDVVLGLDQGAGPFHRLDGRLPGGKLAPGSIKVPERSGGGFG